MSAKKTAVKKPGLRKVVSINDGGGSPFVEVVVETVTRVAAVSAVALEATRFVTIRATDPEWDALAKDDIRPSGVDGAYVRLDPLDRPREEALKLRDAYQEAGARVVVLPGRHATEAAQLAEAPAAEELAHREVVLELMAKAPAAHRVEAVRIMDAEGL